MPKILLVDSDVTLLARLSAQLEEVGYQVVRASDTHIAEAVAGVERPDLILLDTGMHSEDGWVLLRALAPQFAVLILSDRGLEEDVVQGLDAGAVDYITKPYRTAELLARIRARLRPAVQQAAVAPASFPITAPPVPHEPSLTGGMSTTLAANAAPSRPQRRVRRADEPEDDPVFIPSREEHALLNTPEDTPAPDISHDDLAHMSFGARLRAARQRRRITLVQAELESKIRMHYIQAMEEEKFALLPRGPFAEEMVRNYATYVGLDGASMLEEYRRHHSNGTIAPLPSLGGSAQPRRLPGWLIPVVAAVLALLVGFGGISMLDPHFMPNIADRARAMVIPPTVTPTPTATSVPTFTATAQPTPSPTLTATPTVTPAPTLTATPTLSSTTTITGTATTP